MTGGKAMGGIQRELGLNFPLQDENGPAKPEDITEEKGVVWGAPASWGGHPVLASYLCRFSCETGLRQASSLGRRSQRGPSARQGPRADDETSPSPLGCVWAVVAPSLGLWQDAGPPPLQGSRQLQGKTWCWFPGEKGPHKSKCFFKNK